MMQPTVEPKGPALDPRVTAHLESLLARRPELAVVRQAVVEAFSLLRDSFVSGGTLYLAGNGGSASDCEHFSAELLKSFLMPRPLPPSERLGLPVEVAESLELGLPAVPLTGFMGLRSAMSNDVQGPYEFAQLVQALARPGDVLCCITTSGNSANLVQAVHVARARGVKVLGVTARDGGVIARLCDVEVRAPAGRTFEAQELHLPIYHALALMLEAHFFA
ncbi:MAG: SIS domain-containing protein [Planctomycetota bacterium]